MSDKNRKNLRRSTRAKIQGSRPNSAHASGRSTPDPYHSSQPTVGPRLSDLSITDPRPSGQTTPDQRHITGPNRSQRSHVPHSTPYPSFSGEVTPDQKPTTDPCGDQPISQATSGGHFGPYSSREPAADPRFSDQSTTDPRFISQTTPYQQRIIDPYGGWPIPQATSGAHLGSYSSSQLSAHPYFGDQSITDPRFSGQSTPYQQHIIDPYGGQPIPPATSGGHPGPYSGSRPTVHPHSGDQPTTDPRLSGQPNPYQQHTTDLYGDQRFPVPQPSPYPSVGGQATPNQQRTTGLYRSQPIFEAISSGQRAPVPQLTPYPSSSGQANPNLQRIPGPYHGQPILEATSAGHFVPYSSSQPNDHLHFGDPRYSRQPTPNQQRINVLYRGQTILEPTTLGQRTLVPRSSGQSTPDPRPSGQPINDGIYIITNKYQHRFVYLEDPNDTTPLKGHFRPGNRNAQWHVRNYGNEQYSIENVEHNRYADSGNRAEVKAHVEGSSKERLWHIQAIPTGEYTIATTDTENFWMLPSDIADTPVELFHVYTDRRCQWTFNSAETAAPVDENPTPRPVMPDPKLPLAPSGGQPIPNAAIVEFASTIAGAPDLLQPLGAACEALRALLQMAESIGHVNEDQKALVKRLNFHLATVKIHIAQLKEDQKIDETIPALNQDVRESLETYARELKEIPELLLVDQPKNSFLENTVISTTRKIDETFQNYTTSLYRFASSTIDQMREQLAQSRQESERANGTVENVALNRPNAYGIQHRECLQGTREKTLPAISDWVDDENAKNWIFFFLDVAGSGKSTIAKHMAENWKREKRLLARFFFSRDTTATMSTDLFCSTVANAFAVLDPEFKEEMGKFAKRLDLTLLSFEEQFEGLVVSPLKAIGRRAVLVIDALDECHPVQRDQMLETLRTQHSSIPLLRVFVTGRPERDIKRWANDKFGFGYTNFIQLEKGDKDVELYIKHRLQDLPIAQDRLYPVIRNAEGLFIWARIACDLILKTVDIDGLLEELGKEVSLDYLYKVALEQSTPKEGASRRAMALVLQMILAAREPLSIVELEMLSPKRGVVENVITCLSSVLLYQNREDPIRLLHATFKEFLTARSKANIFFIQPELGHHTLASGCLDVISHQSKQDNITLHNVDRISNRKTISYFGKMLINSASRMFIYSSKSWVHHCSMSYRKLALNEQILEFANGALKTWIDLVAKWQGVDAVSCVGNVLPLSGQNMSLQVTEILVSQSLEAIVRA